MKTAALCFFALGAVTAASAADKDALKGADASALQALFSGANAVNWEKFSPQALGMQLNYDEMTREQLLEVAGAFVSLGLIGPEEVEDFVAALTDPRMRRMITSVVDKWPQTMQRVMNDPKYQAFLQEFEGGFNEQALAKIVGLQDGLAGAAARIESQGAGALEDGSN